MSSPHDDPQDWLAMQYVLGELSETEQQAFEDLLASDLAACEAVTRASRLLLTAREVLAKSRPVPAVVVSTTAPSKPVRSSWLVVVVSSAAAAMLCVLGSQAPVKTPGVAGLTGRDPAAAELVSLWHSGMAVAYAESDDLDELADATGDVAVPGWMLAAVSFEADGPNDVQEN